MFWVEMKLESEKSDLPSSRATSFLSIHISSSSGLCTLRAVRVCINADLVDLLGRVLYIPHAASNQRRYQFHVSWEADSLLLQVTTDFPIFTSVLEDAMVWTFCGSKDDATSIYAEGEEF